MITDRYKQHSIKIPTKMKYIICLLFTPLCMQHLPARDIKSPDAILPIAGDSASVPNEILETAYLLTAIGKYEDAHAYFVYALKDMPVRQVFNNAGIVAILDALHYFRPTEPEVRFHYPVELDLESVGTRDVMDLKDVRNKKLKEAISHFDAAIRLDSDYAPAYLNKACAYTLLGDTAQARNAAAAATGKSGYEKTTVDALVLQGILYARSGENEKAQAAFKTAAGQGSALAMRNLSILNGEKEEKPDAPFRINKDESIDGITLDDPYNIPEVDPESEIGLNTQINFYHNLHPGANCRFYFNDNTASGLQTYFLLTGPEYTGTTAEKLKSGASAAEIETAYGKPLRTIETLAGEIRVYTSIMLFLGKDGKLTQWAVYGERG